jgi:DNA-binding HxlR family transcriptional regulator
MTTYGQFCPIALASAVVAERWTPLILRELLLVGARRFNEIQQGVGAISQSVLVSRLEELERAGLIERRRNRGGRGFEYHPTAAALEFEPLLRQFAAWAQRWIEIREVDCDPAYLMTAVTNLLQVERLPLDSLVVRFDLRPAVRPYWLILDRSRPELCFHDPGRDIALVIAADLAALADVIMGQRRWSDAVASGAIEIDGNAELARRLPDWIGLSVWAPYGRALDGAGVRRAGARLSAREVSEAALTA